LNVFQWLKVGIALFLIISKPHVIIEPDHVTTKFNISNLLTDEMIGLVNNGMELEYEAYVSIIALDYSNQKVLFKNKIRRKIKYDYLNSNYSLYENEKIYNNYKKIDELISEAKEFTALFNIKAADYKSFNYYIEIRLIENQIIENNLKMKTEDLWNGYRPSLNFICDSKGNEL
jgi:hypothetical protein